MTVTSIPGLILAAGRGERFRRSGGSGPKVLSVVDGRPLLDHVVASAIGAGLDPLLVVVPQGLRMPRTGSDEILEWVINSDPDRGIGASLSLGLSAVARRKPEAPACAVLLGDQPGIDVRIIAAVLAEWRRVGGPVRADYDDGPGHPVVLPRRLWADLSTPPPAERTADVGARVLLERMEVSPVRIPGPAPRDIDTLDDLRWLRGSRADG